MVGVVAGVGGMFVVDVVSVVGWVSSEYDQDRACAPFTADIFFLFLGLGPARRFEFEGFRIQL